MNVVIRKAAADTGDARRRRWVRVVYSGGRISLHPPHRDGLFETAIGLRFSAVVLLCDAITRSPHEGALEGGLDGSSFLGPATMVHYRLPLVFSANRGGRQHPGRRRRISGSTRLGLECPPCSSYRLAIWLV